MDQAPAVQSGEAVRRVAPDFPLDLLNRPWPLLVIAEQQAEDRRVNLTVFLGRGEGTLLLPGKVLPFRATAPGQFALSPGPLVCLTAASLL